MSRIKGIFSAAFLLCRIIVKGFASRQKTPTLDNDACHTMAAEKCGNKKKGAELQMEELEYTKRISAVLLDIHDHLNQIEVDYEGDVVSLEFIKGLKQLLFVMHLDQVKRIEKLEAPF